ncbi:hypothetical protein D3C77_641520 [compost metagenome]
MIDFSWFYVSTLLTEVQNAVWSYFDHIEIREASHGFKFELGEKPFFIDDIQFYLWLVIASLKRR